MMASAGGGGNHWILRYNFEDTGSNDQNTYAAGMIIINDVLYSQTYSDEVPDPSDERGPMIVEIDVDGNINDQLIYYDNTSPNQQMWPSAISKTTDGTKILSTGIHQYQGNTNRVGYLAQIDVSTFSLDWFSKLPAGTATIATVYAFAAGDGGSNVFTVQNYRAAGTYRATIDVLKSSDGTRQSTVWAGTPREVYVGGANGFVNNVVYDDVNDYIIATGNAFGSGGLGGYEAWQFAVDTNITGSPSLAWKRSQSYSSSTDDSNTLFVDGSQNVYTAVKGSNRSWIRKRNSSGTVQWTANISPNSPTPASTGSTPNVTTADSITVDGSGNVYVAGYRVDGTGASTDRCIFIQKYNSSGTFQWAITIKHNNGYNPSAFATGHGLVLSSDDSTLFYQSSFYNSTEGIFQPVVISYPTDGSITGTYGDWTITSYTYTADSGSLGDNSGAGITISARSITRDTASMNDTNSATVNVIEKQDL